jgi:proton-dependent oligopeptide transporter, POT family
MVLNMDTISTASAPRLNMLAAHPRGLSALFFTELWERFSYYGMRALLTLFMVAPIASGGLAFATEDAGRIYGNYTMAVYMLAIPGGFIADRMTGARRAVLLGGWTIAAGHYALAVPSLSTFYLGLLLVALGTGLFKPNISALVGALYAPDDMRRDAGFSIFYMGVNIGAFIAPLVTGFLAQSAWFKNFLASAGFDPAKSWHWGFAAAGVGMTLAMLIFARNSRTLEGHHAAASFDRLSVAANSSNLLRDGALAIGGTMSLLALALVSDIEGYANLRWLFLALPLAGIAYASRQPGEDAQRLAAIGVLFIAAMIFWAVFEQAGTTIALFADKLTRTEVSGVPFPSSWFQAVNPIFVILLAPLFAALWMAMGSQQPAPAVKFAFGLLFLSSSFLLMVPAANLAASGKVSALWLVGLFFLQTVGELLLSPVGLSTMTKLAPERMTGVVLGIWFLAAAFGNKLAGVLGGGFTSEDPKALAAAFLTQAALVAIAAGLLFLAAPWVKKLSQNVR